MTVEVKVIVHIYRSWKTVLWGCCSIAVFASYKSKVLRLNFLNKASCKVMELNWNALSPTFSVHVRGFVTRRLQMHRLFP